MSKTAPSPKQNIMQTLLTVAVIFLGMQLFMNAMKQPPDKRSADVLLTEMRKENAALNDVSIANLSQTYLGKLREEKLSPDERLAREIEAAVLVADTQLKGGLKLNESSRVSMAYHTLQPLNKKHAANPLWTERVVDLTEDPLYQAGDATPAQLYDRVVTTLSERNRKELAWGFAPGWQIMDGLVAITGRVPALSYAFAAFVLAVIVRAIIFPLAQKQMMFSRQMSQLQPLVAEVREKFKSDPQQQQMKIMEIYKEYGINPMAGCFPLFLQMPLFLLVYQFMLQYQFEFQKGVFFWINPGMSASTGGFIAPNLGQQDYILLVVYGISMIVTAFLMPVSDPAQARQQRIMGVSISAFFAVMMFFWPLPSAFVLYWIFTNVLSTAQALRAYRLPLPPLMKVNTPTGGVYPTDSFFGKGTKNGQAGDASTNGQTKTGRPAKHKPKKRK